MNSADLQRFSLAVLALNSCAAPDDLCGAVTAAMIALADADIHVVHTFGSHQILIDASTAEISSSQIEAFYAHLTDHPFFDLIDGTPKGRGGTRRWSDTTTLRQFQQRALYHDFFRPLGVKEQLSTGFTVTAEVSVALAFNRSLPNFKNEEVRLLKAFVPHVRQLVLRMIGSQEVASALALREYAHDAGAALVVDRPGRVHFVSNGARRLLRDYFPAHAGQPEELPGRLLQFLRGNPSPDARLTLELGDRRLICAAGPLTPWDGAKMPGWMHRAPEPAEVRCIHLREESDFGIASTLQGLGLTPRESEVLRWMMEGKRNGEIAQILKANPNTIRTHVEHILQKLGVETRTAAAAQAVEALRRCR